MRIAMLMTLSSCHNFRSFPLIQNAAVLSSDRSHSSYIILASFHWLPIKFQNSAKRTILIITDAIQIRVNWIIKK